MTLSDRRLLIELGAVLVIKICVIILLKIFFFSPDTERTEAVTSRFIPVESAAPPDNHTNEGALSD